VAVVAVVTAGAIVALVTARSTVTKEPSPSASPSPPATTVVIYGPPPRAPATTLGAFPKTTQDVVVKFGGTVDEWMALPPNGWVYRGTSSGALNFTVPAACLVDDPTGRHRPGEHVDAAELTSTVRRDAYCRYDPYFLGRIAYARSSCRSGSQDG
jgi:hypothetical protein